MSISEDQNEEEAVRAHPHAGRYLTFLLGEEQYGVSVQQVSEIVEYSHVTPVPGTLEFMRGVINLRGKILPVIDLAMKLSMEPIERTEETCIVLVRANDVEMGLIVDRVHEVATLTAADLDSPPDFGVEVNTKYLLGVSRVDGGKVRMLLDIDKLLSKAEIVQLTASRESFPPPQEVAE